MKARKKEFEGQKPIEVDEIDTTWREKLENSVERYIETHKEEDKKLDKTEMNFFEDSEDELDRNENLNAEKGGVYTRFKDYEKNLTDIKQNKIILKVESQAWGIAFEEPVR